MRAILLTALALTAAAPVPGAAQAHGAHSTHAGKEVREIKALSAGEVEEILAGRGMGLAIPAELNRYPGPRHTLDLAGELRLTEVQAAGSRAAFEEMQREAVSLGREYLDRERELDRMFAERTVTEEALRRVTAEIARLQGARRYVHLRAHLQTTALLTPEQIEAYHRHRGYAGGDAEGHRGH